MFNTKVLLLLAILCFAIVSSCNKCYHYCSHEEEEGGEGGGAEGGEGEGGDGAGGGGAGGSGAGAGGAGGGGAGAGGGGGGGKVEVVAGQLFRDVHYKGPMANLVRFINESKTNCRRIPANVYGQVSSLKILSNSPKVAFFAQDNCQGKVLFTAPPGKKVPSLLSTGLNDHFKSYKFV